MKHLKVVKYAVWGVFKGILVCWICKLHRALTHHSHTTWEYSLGINWLWERSFGYTNPVRNKEGHTVVAWSGQGQFTGICYKQGPLPSSHSAWAARRRRSLNMNLYKVGGGSGVAVVHWLVIVNMPVRMYGCCCGSYT